MEQHLQESPRKIKNLWRDNQNFLLIISKQNEWELTEWQNLNS